MPSTTRFEFRRTLTPIGFVYVPVARVVMSYHGASIELEMTVDSGADLSMIPHQVGLALGMKQGRAPLRQLTGVAGGVPYVLMRARYQVGAHAFPARVAWAQRDEVPMLLGRVDVFSRFTITLDERRRVVTFRR